MVTASAQDTTPECRMRQEMYAYVYDHPMVKQLMDGYTHTKQNSGLMGRAVQGLEDSVVDLASRAVPTYEYYLQPRVDAVHSVVNKGVENTMRVVDITKLTAARTTTIGIGAAFVVSQMIISLGLAGTNWIIDSVIAAREAGEDAVGRLKGMEKLMEDRFKEYVSRAQDIAQIPVSKLTGQANAFLDGANKVMDRALGVEGEEDPANCTIGNRLLRMVTRLSRVLQNRALDAVVDPMASQMHIAMERLNSYMKLVDYIHGQREWVVQRIEGMHASVNHLKANVERQANELMSKPEVILVQSVRNTSKNIIENISTLKGRGAQLLSENVVAKLDNLVAYLSQLEHNFAEVNDLYELGDEVLVEARSKISDFLSWTSGLLVHKNSGAEAEIPKNDSDSQEAPGSDLEVPDVDHSGAEEEMSTSSSDCPEDRTSDFELANDKLPAIAEEMLNGSSDSPEAHLTDVVCTDDKQYNAEVGPSSLNEF